MEMEKKILNKNIQCKTEWKGNGNGMEKKSKNQMEFKFDGVEWKWKGNGMEIKRKWTGKKRPTTILRIEFEN